MRAHSDDHIDQVRRIAHPVTQPAHIGVPRAPLGGVAPMLARVAIALRRAGALGVPGVWTRRRNIIVPRKAGGGTPAMCLGTVRLTVHVRSVRPFRRCSIRLGRGREKFGFNLRFPPICVRIQNFCTERRVLRFSQFEYPRTPATRCCAGIKRFLRVRSRRASLNLSVQNRCTLSSHRPPPSAEHPEMGSASAHSRRAGCIGLYV